MRQPVEAYRDPGGRKPLLVLSAAGLVEEGSKPLSSPKMNIPKEDSTGQDT